MRRINILHCSKVSLSKSESEFWKNLVHRSLKFRTFIVELLGPSSILFRLMSCSCDELSSA